MPKVIQIRDVPDEVHEILVGAAAAQGLSLTRYVLRELEGVARRAEAVRHNTAVIRQTQAEVRGHAEREGILDAIREGRGE